MALRIEECNCRWSPVIHIQHLPSIPMVFEPEFFSGTSEIHRDEINEVISSL